MSLFTAAIYYYFINLDERGEFSADVRNASGKTIYGIDSAEAMHDMVTDGFMKHKKDLAGLHEYLISVGLVEPISTLRIG